MNINDGQLHPRMLYEVINHIKIEGSITKADICSLMKKFSDLNNPIENRSEVLQTYGQFALDALEEIVDDVKENTLRFSQLKVKSQALSKSTLNASFSTIISKNVSSGGNSLDSSFQNKRRSDKIMEKLKQSKIKINQEGIENVVLDQICDKNEL